MLDLSSGETLTHIIVCAKLLEIIPNIKSAKAYNLRWVGSIDQRHAAHGTLNHAPNLKLLGAIRFRLGRANQSVDLGDIGH